MPRTRSTPVRSRPVPRFAAPALVTAVFSAVALVAGGAADPDLRTAAANPVVADELGTLESYRKALSVVERAIGALGGREGVAALDSISFTLEMVVEATGQSPRPQPPYLDVPVILEVEAAPGRRWARVVTTTTFPDVSFRTVRLLGPAGGVEIDPGTGRSRPAALAWEDFARDLRRAPQPVIRDAWERRSQLRWSGTSRVDGTLCDLVSFPYAGREQLTVAIDAVGRVLRLEFLVDDFVSGDATVVTGFSDYRRDGDRWLPGGMWQVEAATAAIEGRFSSLAVGSELGVATFTPAVAPQGVPQGTPAVDGGGESESESTGGPLELAEGVHLLTGLEGDDYNSLLVDLGGYFVVLEAPLGRRAAAEIVAAAALLDRDKPIRYVVPTHHHDDHAGGVPHLVFATGAAIVTTPGNERPFRAATAARRTLADPAISPSGPGELVLVREGEWELRGDRTVRLLDLGPNGHADEMLVAWLPESGILFQGDLIRFPESGPVEAARPQGRHLLEFLEARRIAPDRIAGVHGRVGSLAELREAVAASAETTQGAVEGARPAAPHDT